MSIEAEVMKQFQQAQGDSGKPATHGTSSGEYRSAHGGPVEILTSADVAERLGAKAAAFRDAQASGMYARGGVAQTTHNGGTGERYFTRSEVVAALRTIKAISSDNFNAREALDSAIRVFQRME